MINVQFHETKIVTVKLNIVIRCIEVGGVEFDPLSNEDGRRKARYGKIHTDGEKAMYLR